MCATLDFVYKKIHISATLASQTAPTAAISYAAHLARRALSSRSYTRSGTALVSSTSSRVALLALSLISSPILAPTKDVLTLRTPKQRKKRKRRAPYQQHASTRTTTKRVTHTQSHRSFAPFSRHETGAKGGALKKHAGTLSLSEVQKKEAAAEAKTTIGGTTIQTSLA